MKIYLTKDEVLKILVKRFSLSVSYHCDYLGRKENYKLVEDELYWEGNEEKT